MVNPLFVSSVSKDGMKLLNSQQMLIIINMLKINNTEDYNLLRVLLMRVQLKILNLIVINCWKNRYYSIKLYKERLVKKEISSLYRFFFPSDNPKYSCIVVVNNPRKNGHYGKVAAPIFKELSDNVYANDINIYTNKLCIIKKSNRFKH